MCMAAGVIVNVAQVSFKPSAQAIKPDFKKINPMSGFRNVFGIRMASEGLKALAKVVAVGSRRRDGARCPSSRTSARASTRRRPRSGC